MPTKPKSLSGLYLSLIASTAFAALLVAATFWFAALRQTEVGLVRHTLVLRDLIVELIALMDNAETGQRGYVLTGRDVYLAPYESAVKNLPATLDNLGVLVVDPSQQKSVARIKQLTNEKLDELGSTIALRRAGDLQGALTIVNNDSGLHIMDELRSVARTLVSEENQSLLMRQDRAARLDILLRIGAATAFIVICGAGILGSLLARRAFREVVAANATLMQQINKREIVESQLRQAQKMEAVGQLTGGIAHDFNNMLAVIGGSLDLMRRRIAKGDFGIERFIGEAQRATERAAALTHRLLAFSRQQPLRPEPVNANRMIAELSDLLRSTLGEQIRIEVVSAAGLWMTNADVNQLESAVLNVAINARDAMPEGGKLTIETANAYLDDVYCQQQVEVEPGQYVMIAITDTGVGMAPDVVARAFDPFFTTKPSGKGTGLGLSQVFGFVKQSHGHVKIYSEIGTGTTLKIYLPRAMSGSQAAERPVLPPEQGGSRQDVILVVEDDPLMRRHSAEALTELGYTVVDSENAAAALAVLKRRPDVTLLFTDVVMPDVNGKELADEALKRRPDLKVLFTTGYTHNAVVHGGVLDAGVNLLGKPFTLEQLAAKVRMVLKR
jgi:signal transduction histidine kinase